MKTRKLQRQISRRNWRFGAAQCYAVILAIKRLIRQLPEDEPLRQICIARVAEIRRLRKQNRKIKPKPEPMMVELFIPRFEDIEAFSVELDVSTARGLQSWDWWRNVWNGTA